MKHLFIALLLVYIIAPLSASTTTTKEFVSSDVQTVPGNPYHTCDYWRVLISDEGDRYDLTCYGEGSSCCRWFDPNSSGNSYFEAPAGLFQLGQAQILFDYADAQVAAATYSGSYTANYVISGVTYYRNVTWSYNTSSHLRDAAVTITQVIP